MKLPREIQLSLEGEDSVCEKGEISFSITTKNTGRDLDSITVINMILDDEGSVSYDCDGL